MTTPVGSIKLSLEIDGSNVDDNQIIDAVRRHMEPAMERLREILQRTQGDWRETARSAEASGAKQSAAAHDAAGAVKDLGEEQTKTAAKTRTAEGISTRSINSQTRAIDRQTAAWERLAAAKTAAAAAPTPDGPSGGGRGGGGGGGRGGGGSGAFGDLFTGQGGGSRFLTSPVGLNALALGADALPAAALAVTNLTGAVQQLGQAGLLIPGIFATIGSSVGVGALAFKGLADAYKTFDPTLGPKAAEKAKAAFDALDPSAQRLLTTIHDLSPAFQDIQKLAAAKVFSGLDKDVKSLADKTLPTLRRGVEQIGPAINGTFKELGRVAGLDSSQSFLDKIFGNTAEAQTRANAAIEPIVHAVGQLASESSDFVPRLADGVGKLATRLDNAVTKSVGDGTFDRLTNEGIDAAKHVGDALLNVLKILNDITKAAGGDGGFLKFLDDASTKLEAFLSSADGQERLTRFFTDGKAKLDEYLPVLRDIVRIAVNVVQGFQQWGAIILPVVGGVANILAEMPGSLSVFVTGLLALKTTAGLAGLLSTLTGINTQLGGIGGKTGGGGAGGGLLGGRNVFGGALTGLAAGAVGNELLTPTGPDGKPVDPSGLATLGGFAANIGGGALAGAQIGGPVGAAAGATIGAIVSVFEVATNAIKSAEERGKKFLEDSNTQRPDDIDRPGSKEAALAANPALRGQMRPDLYFPDGSSRPTISQDIAAGKVPGLTIGPDGQVMGPNGPIAGLKLQPPAPLPPAPPAVPPVPMLQGVPVPVAPPEPVIKPSPNPLLPPTVPAPPAVQSATAANPILAGTNALGQAQTQVQQLATDIQRLPEGEIKIKDPSPDVLANLGKVDAKITDLGNNEIKVKANTDQAGTQIDALIRKYQSQQITIAVTASGGIGTPPAPQPGRADGGVLPGYSPGVDNMLVPMSGGEGVVIPEAMRALGSGWLYGLNSRFRGGLSRRGYAGGGVVNHLGTGAFPGPVDADGNPTELLQKIVDLLAGKGPSGAPLQVLAQKAALGGLTPGQRLAGQLPGTTPGRIGPFGTPIKPRNPGYEMAAAAIQALGGDPEKFIGPDPVQYFSQQFDQMLGTGGGGTGGRRGGLPGLGGPADFGGAAAALSAFAKSGKVGDLAGIGLDANDSVVKAIAAARNKKKGGLSDDDIAGLVDQVLTGGGFAGTLDSSNTSLVSSLQSYREKLAKGGAVGRGMALTTTDAASMALPLGANADSVIALAQQANGGKYAAASDLAGGLADCSGAVSDLVEQLTQGGTNPGRLFTTGNEAQVLQSLGAVPGFIPGNLNIGVSPTHTAATLPNGVNFESGGSGGGVVYGGNAKGALDGQFTQRFSLPTGAGGGLGGGLLGGGAGGPVPVYIVGGPGGGPAGFGGLIGKPVADALAQSGGQVAADVAGDAVQAFADTPLPGLDPETLTKPAASNNDLVAERNPLALASLAGFKVPDFTRQGGQSDAGIEDTGKSFDASGRVFSDTGALLDRTFSSLMEQQQAQFQQTLAVLNEVKGRLAEDALKPVVTAAVQDAFNGLKDSVLSQLGTQIGQAAGPPIADAVKSVAAAQSSPGGVGGLVAQTGATVGGAIGLATGGGISGGTPGRDSVPILGMPGEHMFTVADVNAMGGQAGVYAFRAALHRNGGIRRMATGGGVSGNATVGADFFGVSQVPILSTIVNFLVQLLLKMIGLNIEVRDTLNEMSSEVRQFRGDFQKFDASGRLINDTSALLDRSSSSEQEVADERVRILKLVIQAIIKYLIEKVIVPIAKAVANAAISAVGSAAGAAVNTQAPGAGGIVSAVISSAGQAGVEIFAEIASDFAVSLSSVLVDSIAEGLQDLFPDLVKGVFSGAGFEQLLAAPVGDALGGAIGGIAGLFATLVGSLPLGGKGDFFDSGGLAVGTGMMPKATVSPERVLSPRETAAFERALGGGFGGSSSSTHNTVHADIHMHGAQATPERVRSSIMELIT